MMQSFQIRLTDDLVARVRALIPRLERDPRVSAKGRITFALALRIALQRGLEVLEAAYPEEPRGGDGGDTDV